MGTSLPTAGRPTGAQFQVAQLRGGERRPGPERVLLLGPQMPDQHGQLAGRGDDRKLLPAPRPEPKEKGPQGARGFGHGPGGLHQHAAGMGVPLFADASMRRGVKPRLPDSWVQPEIADQLLGIREPGDLPNSRYQRHRDGRIDSGNGHQPPGGHARQGLLGYVSFEARHLLGELIERPEQAGHGLPLIGRERLAREPDSPAFAKQIRIRTGRHKIPMQDRMNLILDLRSLADHLLAARDLAPSPGGLFIGQPHLRQKPRRESLREHRGINRIRLNLRIRNGSRPQRVGNHHATGMRLQDAGDRLRVARRLQDHVILGGQRGGKAAQRLRGGGEPPRTPTPAPLNHGHFCKRPMHI